MGGGAFAETIIGTLFGYAAKPGSKFALTDAGCDADFAESCIMCGAEASCFAFDPERAASST